MSRSVLTCRKCNARLGVKKPNGGLRPSVGVHVSIIILGRALLCCRCGHKTWAKVE